MLRRENEINNFIDGLPGTKCDLLEVFDENLFLSSDLRQYLWAHSDKDVEVAREIVEVLPAEAVKKILKYLIGDYWGRYLGWPDLLVFSEDEFLFAEVKGSKDKLSEEQKEWIKNNHEILCFPYQYVKIHRTKTVVAQIHRKAK